MVVKGNDTIGLKVVTLEDGTQIGTVKDIIYDPGSHEVRALLLEAAGLFSEAKVVLIDNIHSIGQDAVTIMSGDMVTNASEAPGPVSVITEDNQYLTKTHIVTEDGNDLGQVTDIYFDPHTGKVSELEVSQGLIKNVQSGKKRVRVSDIITVGKDATIVRAQTEQVLDEQGQTQGVQGAWNQTQQKAQEFKESPQTQSFMDTVSEKAQQAKQATKEAISSAGQKVQDFAKSEDVQNIKGAAAHQVDKARDSVRQQAEQRKQSQPTPPMSAQEKTDVQGEVEVHVEEEYTVVRPSRDTYRYSGVAGGKSEHTKDDTDE